LKRRSAYSCYLAAQDSWAVKLSLGGESPYELEWVEVFGGAGAAPAQRLKELGGQGSQVIQLLVDDEVSLLISALPRLKREQTMIALRGLVRQQKDGAQDDWVVDYQDLPDPDPAGPQRDRGDVSALFVKKVVLEQYYQLARDLGIRPKGLLPGYMALEQLYRRHHSESASAGAWNLVHLGQTEPFLCVADEHGMLLTRSLPEDLSGGVERDEYFDRLVAEIERSNFFAQQAERSMHVQRIVVCGDPELSAALTEKLSATSDFEVQNWRAEELFATADGIAPWERIIPMSAAAAAFYRPPYDLLPAAARKGRHDRARRYVMLAASTFGMAAVPILLVGSLMTTQVQGEYLAGAKKEMARAERRVETAAVSYLHDRMLQSRQSSVDLYGRDLPDLAALLRDIALRTPATVVYTTLDVREDTAGEYSLVLQGKSVARDGFAAQATFLEFLAALAACDRIREIKEPTYLEIGRADEDGPPRSQAVFTLEYQIRQGGV